MNISDEETIVALATPPGRGALAVIRLSGSRALEILGAMFSKDKTKLKSHTATLGYLVDSEGSVIDQVVVTPFLEGRSFTGEELVEITPHGGDVIVQKILQTARALGARAALPGEFSLRAWKNGKIDLVQAESIQNLIAAKSESARKAHLAQLSGALSERVRNLQDKIIEMLAVLEAWVDFPEEGLEYQSFDEVIAVFKEAQDTCKKLINTYDYGSKLKSGLSCCLIGAPNVGKSSLLNALLEKERAIVTAEAGTTRDFLEEELWIEGVHVRLIDTAGIRESQNAIEKEGIRRSEEKSEEAGICLIVLDAPRFIKEEDSGRELLAKIPGDKRFIIWNKVDLLTKDTEHLPHIEALQTFKVSAKTGAGIEELKKSLADLLNDRYAPSEEIILTEERHVEALQKAESYIGNVIEGLENKVSAEFVAFDARASLEALANLVGRNIKEDVITAIFSQFCLGK